MPLPTVLTIHDLSTTLYPQHHTRLHRIFARMVLPQMAQRADAIIADSHATKADIIKHLHMSSDKVTVIHLGVDHARFKPYDPKEAQERVMQRLDIHRPYILAVGTLEPRKNLATLLRAYARMSPESPSLILVGARGWGESPLYQVVEQLGLQQRVQFTGFVPDELLPQLYCGAEFFIYPSLYEGFGLPVIEAMACGTPVITSNISSLPEVTAEAALLVDPTDIEALSSAMRTLLLNDGIRARFRAGGPIQAAQFTWERTAAETFEVYRRTVAIKRQRV